jgi:hypothetical protein
VDTPREEPTQIVPLQQRPLQGPSRPTETPEDATPTGVLIGNLILTVERQTSLIEEQNRRLMDLEQARHIERFNKEVVQVRGAIETMKLYLIAKGLREKMDVKKVVLLDRPRTLNEFLAIAKIYIAYEEALYADSLNKVRKEEPAAESSKKPFQEKKKESKAARESKRPSGHFTEYTLLPMSREKILAEIAVADLAEVGIKPPKASSQERKGINTTK